MQKLSEELRTSTVWKSEHMNDSIVC